MSQEVTELADANPSLLAALGVRRGRYLVTMAALVITCTTAAAAGVQAIGRLGEEEDTGRLQAVLATPLSRTRAGWSWVVVAGAVSLGVLAVGSLALGLFTAAVTGDVGTLTSALSAGPGMPCPSWSSPPWPCCCRPSRRVPACSPGCWSGGS